MYQRKVIARADMGVGYLEIRLVGLACESRSNHSAHCNLLAGRKICEFARFEDWLYLGIAMPIAPALTLKDVSHRLRRMGGVAGNSRKDIG